VIAKRNTLLLFALLATLSVLTACTTAAPPASPGSVAVGPSPQARASAKPSPTASSPAAIATPASDAQTLTWWTPEFFSPQPSQPGGQQLAKYLADFEAAHNGKVRVAPVLKARYGKGGVLDYLRTAQAVAPSLLPDIVVLDTAELESAAASGLLQPLDGLLDKNVLAALYPFARESGQIDGKQVGVQVIADLEHVIYDRGQVNLPPETWTGVLASKISYALPAGSPQPVSVTTPPEDIQRDYLSQYLSAGGVIDPQTRHLDLQDQPLQSVLKFYDDARRASLLAPAALEMTGPDDSFNAYAQGQVMMAHVSARRYLAGRDVLQNTGFAATPGNSAAATPIPTGWALAIVTPDPERQKLAAEFISGLMAPENMGGWTAAAGWLPASPTALATWSAGPYRDFLSQQLGVAVSHPVGADYPQTAARMQKALASVLKGTATPAEAAQAALNPSP
jgi:multiple sugar transport system substrate-binding protein